MLAWDYHNMVFTSFFVLHNMLNFFHTDKLTLFICQQVIFSHNDWSMTSWLYFKKYWFNTLKSHRSIISMILFRNHCSELICRPNSSMPVTKRPWSHSAPSQPGRRSEYVSSANVRHFIKIGCTFYKNTSLDICHRVTYDAAKAARLWNLETASSLDVKLFQPVLHI